MRYNKNIENRLDALPNSEVRKTDDMSSKKYIHDNQIDAAKGLIKAFTAHLHEDETHEARNNHVVLIAKMQSGKTGTCNATINVLEKTKLYSYFNIEKYLYITGMNDNGLHKQTVDRLSSEDEGQVIGAVLDNVCDGDKEINSKPNAKFYVHKNSDLRKNNLKLSNCLIFIDESHFGSNESNVLTKFLEINGIDWKNNKFLKEKNIYIVSVSATPFDEIISDIAECKTVVELETTKQYIGVSEYLDKDCIFDASKNDFKITLQNDNPPIIDYIKVAYDKILNNDNKGVLFIRTRDKKLRNNNFIRENFKVVELDARRGGSIDYDLVYNDIQAMVDATIGSQTNRPIIFFVKGAYRAGITLNPTHKDYVFMVYDHSSSPEATAQGLLGRMCGYRSSNNKFKNTLFYVNKQHAEDYAEWEKDFNSKDSIPSTRVWEFVDDDVEYTTDSKFTDVKLSLPKKSGVYYCKIKDDDLDYTEYKFNHKTSKFNDIENGEVIEVGYWRYPEIKIATKCNGNFDIPLNDEEIFRFLAASTNKEVRNKEFAKNELRLIKSEFHFDYFGEAYISGKNTHTSVTIDRWFDNFDYDTYCPSYRVDAHFKSVNGGREELSIKHDLGKVICHVVLDAEVLYDADGSILKIGGNKRLLVYHGILSKKMKFKVKNNLIKPHKTT